MSPREAMTQAVERAQTGQIEASYLWLAIATELRLGTVPTAVEDDPPALPTPEADQFAGYRRGQQAYPNEQAIRSAQYRWKVIDAGGMALQSERTLLAEILQRAADAGERTDYGTTIDGKPAYRGPTTMNTPIYEQAGDGLGDTALIPARVAHPQADSQGPESTCLSCLCKVIWIRGRGWVHDTEGHPAGCDNTPKTYPVQSTTHFEADMAEEDQRLAMEDERE